MWGDFRVAYKRALFAVITSSAALLAASMVPAAAATDLVAVSAPYLLKAGPVGGPVRTVACGLLVADGQRRDSWRERTGRACRPHGGGRRRLRGAEGRTWPVPRLRQEQRLGHLLPRRRPRLGRRERWGPHLRAQRRGEPRRAGLGPWRAVPRRRIEAGHLGTFDGQARTTKIVAGSLGTPSVRATFGAPFDGQYRRAQGTCVVITQQTSPFEPEIRYDFVFDAVACGG